MTHVGGVRIEFDVFELSRILGISNEGLDLYTSRKELYFSQFTHLEGVRNICRRLDLSNEVAHCPFGLNCYHSWSVFFTILYNT